MTTETRETIRTEAAIYAAGTRFTTDDLMSAYNHYAAEEQAAGREPDDCQRFFERHIAE